MMVINGQLFVRNMLIVQYTVEYEFQKRGITSLIQILVSIYYGQFDLYG